VTAFVGSGFVAAGAAVEELHAASSNEGNSTDATVATHIFFTALLWLNEIGGVYCSTTVGVG
jgi:hypothetical protein